MLPMMPVPVGPPHLDVPAVSNYLSCQRTYLRQPVLLYLCCSLYMHGWVTSTNALPGFSISHAALDGYEWVDGNDRASPVIPGWSPSAKRVNWVIHSEADSWQCPRKYHGSPHSCIPLLFVFSVSSCPRRRLGILNLSTWCFLFPFHFFPPTLSCLSLSYSFSFHPSLWGNIHRTCQR